MKINFVFFFRCLAYHFHSTLWRKCLQFREKVQFYFDQWMTHMGMNEKKQTFNGIVLTDIPHLQNLFKININIFKLCEDLSGYAVYKSLSVFEDSLFLNQYEQHLSYINNIETFCQKYRCSFCSKFFEVFCNLRRHEKSCENKRNLKFLGGFYRRKCTIFEELDNYGINVPLNKRLFKEFIVFDMEAMLKPVQNQSIR